MDELRIDSDIFSSSFPSIFSFEFSKVSPKESLRTNEFGKYLDGLCKYLNEFGRLLTEFGKVSNESGKVSPRESLLTNESGKVSNGFGK